MKEIELDFTIIKLHDNNIAVIEAKSGVNITVDLAKKIIAELDANFVGDYGFLSNAIHAYSLEVGVYQVLEEHKRIKGMALVSYRRSTEIIYDKLEKNIYINKASRLFNDYDAAFDWLEQILNKV